MNFHLPPPSRIAGRRPGSRAGSHGLAWLGLAGILLLSGPAVRAAGPAYPGAAEFAGELLKRPPHASSPQAAALDELNRRLREAEREARTAPGEPERSAALERRVAAARDLVAWLEARPDPTRIAVDGTRLSPPFTRPLLLAADEGAVLWRIDAGPAPTSGTPGEAVSFIALDLDQSRPELTGNLRFDLTGGGVTWVLLGFRRLPPLRTTFPVEILAPGGRAVRTTVSVETPAWGRLQVGLIDDDTGRPTPAMVRITSRAGGLDRKPGNVVDFGGQFDGNGSPLPQRRANLPGRLGGTWWCVAGPFDVTLPPGDYDLAVRRGLEHRPVFTPFTIATGRPTVLEARPRRWTDPRRRGWYSGDDHVHGRILGDDDAERLMAWVQAEDIHLANIVRMGDIFRTFFEQRGWGPAFRVVRDGHVLSPGQECPRTHDQLGHTLSMNTRGMIRDTGHYYLYDRVADEAHAQGGLFGYAHINAGLFHVHRDMTLNVPAGRIDFGEVLQFNRLGTDLWYEFLNTGFKLTAAAGSDVPWGGTVGEVRMYAHTGRRRFSADTWFAAVRRGRTWVSNGPVIEFQVNDALPGDEITVDQPGRKLRVTARAWGDPERSQLRRLTVVRHGETVREAAAADPAGAPHLDLAFEVEAGDGFWIAARADAVDGTAAHTTPVYVVRPPLRFWKHEQAGALLDRRLASLAEIEALVAEARERERAGRAAGDLPVEQLALQADALLERVATARRLYEDLRRTAGDEAGLRQRR